jgi:hypothetical protein
MTIVIDSTNPRSLAALGLMLRAKGWARCRLADGQKYYGIPSRSRPELVHLADTQACTCEDHKVRGADCAHILAVRLHVAQVSAKQALEAKRRARRERHTPEQVAAGSAKYAELFSEEG